MNGDQVGLTYEYGAPRSAQFQFHLARTQGSEGTERGPELTGTPEFRFSSTRCGYSQKSHFSSTRCGCLQKPFLAPHWPTFKIPSKKTGGRGDIGAT